MKKAIIIAVVLAVVGIGASLYVPAVRQTIGTYTAEHRVDIVLRATEVFRDVTRILPLEQDTKAQADAIAAVTQHVLATDGVARRYLVLLQNNMELRPGGGFLGQYAVVTFKDGAITSLVIEDANLADQRIQTKVAPPWPLKRYLQMKNWKLRDSNWSPDYPTNVAKAKYFLGLAGVGGTYDGVIAVNARVLDRALAISGPITVWGVAFRPEDGALKLEEVVEKQFLGDDVPAEAKQSRKNIMKQLGKELAAKLMTPGNIKAVSDLGLAELNNKDVQLFFYDKALQAKVAAAGWDGTVDTTWDGDYVMVVDANLGALKSDYFVKRRMEHVADFTGETPRAETHYYYNHTATYGDWRTSDWHGYVRMIVPAGATYTGRQATGGVTTATLKDFGNKTEFGYKIDAVMGRELHTSISYTLPTSITADAYRLRVQKQSGVGDVPLVVVVRRPKVGATRNPDGTLPADQVEELRYETTLTRDTTIELTQIKERAE